MNDTLTREQICHARRLWDFHKLPMDLPRSDFILALGSHDERVAEEAARLYLNGVATLLVVSGGFGKVTGHFWKVSEGERFGQIAQRMGVPKAALLIESEARNTGDNIIFSRRLLHSHGRRVGSGILVTKPYMSRRAYATAMKQWPELVWSVASPHVSFENYPSDDVPLNRMISLMVGDLQRLKVYADQGFQIPQEVPEEVWSSYEFLRDHGFDQFVIKERDDG